MLFDVGATDLNKHRSLVMDLIQCVQRFTLVNSLSYWAYWYVSRYIDNVQQIKQRNSDRLHHVPSLIVFDEVTLYRDNRILFDNETKTAHWLFRANTLPSWFVVYVCTMVITKRLALGSLYRSYECLIKGDNTFQSCRSFPRPTTFIQYLVYK